MMKHTKNMDERIAKELGELDEKLAAKIENFKHDIMRYTALKLELSFDADGNIKGNDLEAMRFYLMMMAFCGDTIANFDELKKTFYSRAEKLNAEYLQKALKSIPELKA